MKIGVSENTPWSVQYVCIWNEALSYAFLPVHCVTRTEWEVSELLGLIWDSLVADPKWSCCTAMYLCGLEMFRIPCNW